MGQFTSAPEAVRCIVAKEGFKGLFAVQNASPNLMFIRRFVFCCDALMFRKDIFASGLLNCIFAFLFCF